MLSYHINMKHQLSNLVTFVMKTMVQLLYQSPSDYIGLSCSVMFTIGTVYRCCLFVVFYVDFLISSLNVWQYQVCKEDISGSPTVLQVGCVYIESYQELKLKQAYSLFQDHNLKVFSLLCLIYSPIQPSLLHSIFFLHDTIINYVSVSLDTSLCDTGSGHDISFIRSLEYGSPN